MLAEWPSVLPQYTLAGQPMNSEWYRANQMLLIGEDIKVDSLGNTAKSR